MTTIFSEIGGIIILAAACAAAVRLLRLPPLVGYILAGIILGPLVLNVVGTSETLDALRQIGIAFLLFLVGLELDWVKAKNQFRTATVLAITQTAGSFGTGVILALIGHQSLLTGVYLGTALAFSSTVIVVKYLSQAKDQNALHGRLAVGILLVQDVIAMVALVLVSSISNVSILGIGEQVFLLIVKTAAMIALVWILAQYVFPPLFRRLAVSTELLFVSSTAWCFLFAVTMAHFDFPLEMGAFLAGISLAALPYSLDIINRLRSLRDFFLILFFVGLGATMVIPSPRYLVLTAGLVLLTVIVKPVITFITLALNRYRSRTAFLTAITQSQLSEFSLIITAVGLHQGQITGELSSTITFTMVISVLISTYLFGIRNPLYRKLKGFLGGFERHDQRHDEHVTEEIEERLHEHIVIFGYHRMGSHILRKLHELHHRIVVVDFNPDIVRKLRTKQIDCVYGDVEDDEIYDAVHVERASMVVSTIPHHDETLFLIDQVKERSKDVKLIVTAQEIDYALTYYERGADYVILPHLLGGEYVAELITQYQEHHLGQFMKHRAEEQKLMRAKNHTLYFD